MFVCECAAARRRAGPRAADRTALGRLPDARAADGAPRGAHLAVSEKTPIPLRPSPALFARRARARTRGPASGRCRVWSVRAFAFFAVVVRLFLRSPDWPPGLAGRKLRGPSGLIFSVSPISGALRSPRPSGPLHSPRPRLRVLFVRFCVCIFVCVFVCGCSYHALTKQVATAASDASRPLSANSVWPTSAAAPRKPRRCRDWAHPLPPSAPSLPGLTPPTSAPGLPGLTPAHTGAGTVPRRLSRQLAALRRAAPADGAAVRAVEAELSTLGGLEAYQVLTVHTRALFQRAQACMHTHTCPHTHTHKYKHTQTHTLARTHTLAHAHAHKRTDLRRGGPMAASARCGSARRCRARPTRRRPRSTRRSGCVSTSGVLSG
jgi:hypothetical protein